MWRTLMALKNGPKSLKNGPKSHAEGGAAFVLSLCLEQLSKGFAEQDRKRGISRRGQSRVTAD